MPRPLSDKVLASTSGDIDSVRDHILDAALRVIHAEGLAAASTRAIATEAGMAAGTLYNYFGDRIHLLVQIIVRRVSVLSKNVADTALQAGQDTVAGNLQGFVSHSAVVMNELVPLISSVFSDTELLTALRKEMSSGNTAFNPNHQLEQYLLAERELGRISTDVDCAAVASMIVSICHDRAFHRYLSGDARKEKPSSKEINFIADAITRRASRQRKD